MTVDESSPRRLVVMRHAKAEPTGASDFSRSLTERGLGDAAAAGRWCADHGIAPDHALVSAADRTQQTWAALAGAAGWSLEPELDRGLYGAGPESALDLVRLAGEEVRSLVVVGHNPTMATLAQLLDDGTGDPVVGVEMAGGFPTCALTVFEYVGRWGDLAPGAATATAFHVGRA